MLLRILFFTLLLLSFTLGNEIVKVGVLAKRGDTVTISKWSDTAKYLSENIDGYEFKIIPLSFGSLSQAVRDSSIDFVLTNTIYYVELEYLYGISRIATLKNLGIKDEELTKFGGVIFTKKDSPINNIDDLNGKVFGAVDINSFGGWVMAQKEFLDHGLTTNDFKKFEFLSSHDNVVNAVQSGKVDAGTVRSDTLERMASEKLIRLEDFKILSSKKYSDFPYLVSTELYPEWPFAKLSKTSDVLANKVTIALLNMPEKNKAALSAKIAGWTAPLDYSKVHKLLQELQIGPYKAQTQEIVITTKEEDFTLFDVIDFQEFIFIFCLFIFLSFILYKYYKKSSILDIRLSLFNILLVLFELGIIFFLIYEIIVLDRLENSLAIANKNQFEMIKAGDALRQSSDDLTHFARTYVVTGKKEFKNQYYKTLAIRNGEIPRPVGYNQIYWDLNKISREIRHPNGEKIALKTIINLLPFTKEEITKLHNSENNSNALVTLEVEAFNAMEEGKQQWAIELLHSKSYYYAKHRIMLPIDEMISMLKSRTNLEIAYLEKKLTRQFRYLVIVSFFFMIGNIIIYFLLRKKVNIPINYLTNIIKRFEIENSINAIFFDLKEKSFYQDEVGYMIKQFFKMQHRIEEDKIEREDLLGRIQDSIDYSALIQAGFIPRPELFNKHFDEYFTIWEQRDVVGGDIYLLQELENEDEILLMVIDCTGHGVPGALVTVLVKAIERQMVATIKHTKEYVSPAKLLSIFNNSIRHLLQQDNSESISNVGFDGVILYYNKKENIIRFSAANTSVFYVKNKVLEVVNGDKHSIGYKNSDKDYVFTDYEINIDSEISVYLPTNGFIDQNGGNKSFPFGKQRFIKAIEEYNNKNMSEQKQLFLNELLTYQGNEICNDDVTLIAFKVHHQNIV